MERLIKCGKSVSGLAKVLTDRMSVASASRSLFYMGMLDNVEFIVKISVYPVVESDLASPNDTEIAAMRLLKTTIIDSGVSPCVAELLGSNVCKLPNIDCENIASGVQGSIEASMCNFKNMLDRGVIEDKIAYIVIERLDVTLGSYIGWQVDDSLGEAIIKSFLFMIIYTLAAIEVIHPGLRHRDLHVGNIMVKFVRNFTMPVDGAYNKFTINNHTWNVPFYGAFPKLIDFGSAVIPEKNIRSRAEDDWRFDIKTLKNDLEVLFKSIYMEAADTGHTRVKQMINSLNPRMHHASRINTRADDFPSLGDLLRNEIFADYVVKKKAGTMYKSYAVVDRSRDRSIDTHDSRAAARDD